MSVRDIGSVFSSNCRSWPTRSNGGYLIKYSWLLVVFTAMDSIRVFLLSRSILCLPHLSLICL